MLYLVLGTFALACGEKKGTNQAEKNSVVVLKDSLTHELNVLLQKGTIKGFGVAIVNQDTTLYAKGFGYAKLKAKIPYTQNTLQNIASVSKTMIGVALLRAQEMGKLRLEDPVNDYLPFKVINPNHPKDPVTIHHLATHTSSIQDGDTYGAKSYILQKSDELELAKSLPSSQEFNMPSDEVAMETFLENFLTADGAWYDTTNYLKTRPGERYEYTNVGATLAAYIIERATGETYSDFTTEHIIQPLGMEATGWRVADIDSTQLTHLFTVEGNRIPDYRLITYPDGGLITSAADKAKYLSELIRGNSGKGKLLSKASYDQFFSGFLSETHFEEERDTDRPFDDEYNSGLFIGHTPIGYLGHMGGDPGVSTFMFFNPKTKIGKLLFVNTDLDKKGADQFYAIWDTLGKYEQLLRE